MESAQLYVVIDFTLLFVFSDMSRERSAKRPSPSEDDETPKPFHFVPEGHEIKTIYKGDFDEISIRLRTILLRLLPGSVKRVEGLPFFPSTNLPPSDRLDELDFMGFSIILKAFFDVLEPIFTPFTSFQFAVCVTSKYSYDSSDCQYYFPAVPECSYRRCWELVHSQS